MFSKKVLLCMLAGMAISTANAGVIDFTGVNQSGVHSFTVGDVTFADSSGSDLYTAAYYESNGSNALAVFYDDASRLQLSFGSTYDYLSFDFGNDNPGFGDPNGKMHLDLYLNGVLTGAFALTANWDDLMNQNLAGIGLFNYAEIYYDTNLIEVVDNIVYRLDRPVGVPEPSGLGLIGCGLLALGLMRFRVFGRTKAEGSW